MSKPKALQHVLPFRRTTTLLMKTALIKKIPVTGFILCSVLAIAAVMVPAGHSWAGTRYQVSKTAPYSWYLHGLVQEMNGELDSAYRSLETAAELDPEAVPVLVELAKIATRLGRTEEAEQWIEQALALEPDNTRLKMMLARIYASAGNSKSAIEVLDDVLNDEPDNEEALFLLGSLYAQSQKLEEAVATLEKAAKQKGTRSFMAHYYLGKIYMERGDTDRAKEEFLKAAEANPRFTPVYIDLAEIYEDENDEENALKMWQTVMENQPANPRATARTIELLIKTGKLEQASALLDRLSMTHSDLDPLRFKVALMYLQNDQAEHALELLRPMAEKNPDDSRILFYTALALEQNGQIDEAVSTLKSISTSDMLAPEATVRIAYLLNKEGRNWEAVTFLQKRIEEIPGNPQIMLALARIYQDTGDSRQAISLLKEAVEKGHGSKDILMQLAMLCEKLGKRKQGLEWAQRALDLDGNYVPALNFIGYTWAEQGINLDQAEEMVKKAVSLQPDDGYIIDSLGWVYYAQGRYQEAVRELKRAHQLVPDDPTIAEHLADALIKRQKYFQALKIYKKAFELEKDKKNKRRLKKKIRRASDLTSDMIDQ